METSFTTENMLLFLLVILVMFGFVGAMCWIVYRQIQKTDPTKIDTSIDPSITTAQEFLQFQDIKDGAIDLGGHRYRAVIECSSVNYHLKTPTEKEMIEVGYEQFINSLKFPITMFIQTRVIDSTYISKTLEQDMEIVRKKFPNLERYMELYLDSMKNLKHYLPNTKHKKKYVIIPYEDSYLIPDLTDGEKYDYSLNELKNRTDIIKRGLEGIGINCKILDTRDIIEMVYAAYHKEHFSVDKIDAIVDGDFFTLLTTAENKYSTLNSAMKMDLILNEAQNKIRKDILLSDEIDNDLKEAYKVVYNDLDKLRDDVGGHYKEGKTKLNLYENSIKRFNVDNIQNTTNLTYIEEEEIKFKDKIIDENISKIQKLNNDNIKLPKYDKDVYEERGFLDKYDQKRIVQESKDIDCKKEIQNTHKKITQNVSNEYANKHNHNEHQEKPLDKLKTTKINNQIKKERNYNPKNNQNTQIKKDTNNNSNQINHNN